MNFLGHAAVARRLDDDPAFVFGAVLPDLLPMAGLSPRSGRDLGPFVAQIATRTGWARHYRMDEVFHELPAFRAGVQALRADLRATPLGTGPRRAVAHVGWELLLDDTLADEDATVASFRAALAFGRGALDDDAWRGLVSRLDAAHPHPPSTMVAIAARIHVAVGRRPRLAFADEHIDVVAAVLARHRDEVREVAPEVVDAVSSALSS